MFSICSGCGFAHFECQCKNNKIKKLEEENKQLIESKMKENIRKWEGIMSDIKIAYLPLVKGFESLRLFPYRCSRNKLTIGYGRNIEDNGITEEEADFLLSNDVEKTIQEAKTFAFYEDLSDNRKIVLIDMIFNLGFPKFLTFKKFIQSLKEGNYKQAAYEMKNSLWYNQVGYRAITLHKMMLDG